MIKISRIQSSKGKIIELHLLDELVPSIADEGWGKIRTLWIVIYGL